MPKHIRNILIATVIAVVALAAGINGYVHHQFKKNIDNTLTSLQSIARVRYSELSTSVLSGEVNLKNVRVSGAFMPEEINLGNITFETPGFVYMLNGPESMHKGEFPKHLGLAITDFYFDLHGETAGWLEPLVARLQTVYASERKICGGKTLFGPKDFIEMGYTRLLSNMRIAYDFNESNKSLNISMSANTQNMYKVRGSFTITGLGGLSPDKMMQSGKMPQLANAEIHYQDETYTPRFLKYCADLSNMKKEEFIEAEINQSDNHYYMVWGFSPGEGLRNAYKDFLLKPEEISLTITPAADFNLMLLPGMATEEIINNLNLQLNINNLAVTDLTLKLPPVGFNEQFQKRLAASLDVNALLRGEPVKEPEPVVEKKVEEKDPASYHPISLASIPKHIDHFVRITTKNGHERRGRLLRVDKANLYIQLKVSGGKFTMTVPRNSIKKIEAYYSK